MKKIIVTFFLMFTCIMLSQTQSEKKLISSFVKDIFNNSISPKYVRNKYIKIEKDPDNELSLEERKKTVVEVLKRTRNNEGTERTWIIPNKEIREVKDFRIYKFEEFDSLSRIDISGINSIKNRVYILLDDKRQKILQYFLLNYKRDKIISFSLFVKPKNIGWFFSYQNINSFTIKD